MFRSQAPCASFACIFDTVTALFIVYNYVMNTFKLNLFNPNLKAQKDCKLQLKLQISVVYFKNKTFLKTCIYHKIRHKIHQLLLLQQLNTKLFFEFHLFMLNIHKQKNITTIKGLNIDKKGLFFKDQRLLQLCNFLENCSCYLF